MYQQRPKRPTTPGDARRSDARRAVRRWCKVRASWVSAQMYSIRSDPTTPATYEEQA